ncbi:MAG: hypothetical protein JW901_03515 [Dehalococcoidia bacterium]|nr:hypothetical protein [Dehalococcoidia bacterium]
MSAELISENVRRYIERCRLDDGGYFFARIPPSSAVDTYYAVRTLSMLGFAPESPAATRKFFVDALKSNSILSINGLFAATEVLGDLQFNVQLPRRYVDRINKLRNDMGGFGVVSNLDIEVVSELETTYRVLRIMISLGMDFDGRTINDFVLKFANRDGGFGKGNLSTPASTYYAIEIFKLTGYKLAELIFTGDYLYDRAKMWRLNFIEDIFWLSSCMANLGQRIDIADWITSFVKNCQRSNGGFARKDVMGIPSLEYTYYAVSILKTLSFL